MHAKGRHRKSKLLEEGEITFAYFRRRKRDEFPSRVEMGCSVLCWHEGVRGMSQQNCARKSNRALGRDMGGYNMVVRMGT